MNILGQHINTYFLGNFAPNLQNLMTKTILNIEMISTNVM